MEKRVCGCQAENPGKIKISIAKVQCLCLVCDRFRAHSTQERPVRNKYSRAMCAPASCSSWWLASCPARNRRWTVARRCFGSRGRTPRPPAPPRAPPAERTACSTPVSKRLSPFRRRRPNQVHVCLCCRTRTTTSSATRNRDKGRTRVQRSAG